jgi:hypothetical protein
MSNARKAGRRERLLARRRPSIDYMLPVVDDTEARAELEEAKAALEVARLRADEGAGQAVADAEKRVAKARRAVESCYEPIHLVALPPVEFERLVAEHPAREGEEEAWNAETFPRAAFLACVQSGEDDLTPEEWAEWLDANLSQGEREALFLKVLEINARWPSGSLPEG